MAWIIFVNQSYCMSNVQLSGAVGWNQAMKASSRPPPPTPKLGSHKIPPVTTFTACRVALDTEPHPGATTDAMLTSLAGMAAREVDVPSVDLPIPLEWFTNEIFIPPTLRSVMDNYMWVTFCLDTSRPRWPILYGNSAFQGMTGGRSALKLEYLPSFEALESNCTWV